MKVIRHGSISLSYPPLHVCPSPLFLHVFKILAAKTRLPSSPLLNLMKNPNSDSSGGHRGGEGLEVGDRMKNWRGTGGVSSLPSNLSAFAPPFTVPRDFPYPNSTPYCDTAEGSSVVAPANWVRDNWDHLSSGDASANCYLSSSHEVDPNVPYANYYSFSGAEISSDGNAQMPSWDLPVGVASTDCTVSHTKTAGNLGKDVEAGLSHSSYSSFGVAGRDSLLTANHSSFVGSSAPKPSDGKSDKLSSDHHMIGFSSVADAWDDKLDGSAVRYPLKSAQIDGKCRLEEEKSAREHVIKTYNAQDVWSNAWSGPAIKSPLESAWVDGNNWLAEGQLAPQHLTGTSNGDVVQSNGWDGSAVEYPFKSAQVVGEESCHPAPHPELGTDIWKQQAWHAPLWEQSTWWHGPNTDYENLVVKSPSAPAARLRANASSIATGLVTQSKCNNEIDGDNQNFVDMIPYHSMESYPLLGPGNELQFDATATYPRIKPNTNAFESLYMAKDGGLPKEKFSPKNSFDHMPQSNSSSRFSNLYLGNSAMAASTHLACDVGGSDSWGFPSDQATSSLFFDKGLVNVRSVDQPVWDSLYTQDIPIHRATGALFRETEIANTNQAVTVEGSGSFLKPPDVSYASDGEQRFDGTVETGSSWVKEIQSPHGTYRTAATEHDDLPVSSCNLGLNSCFPLQQKLNESEKTPYKMHPCGDRVTTSEKGVQNLSDGPAEATSVLVEEISGSSAPSNISGQEKGELEPKVDLRMMVLTLHNLSGLLHSYCSSGKYEVREEDHHLLEKSIHNLAACSSKDVVFLTDEEEELKISEEEQCLEDSVKPCAGQVDDQLNGEKKQVNSLCNSEEKSSLEMLSSGEDLATVKDNDSTQVDNLCAGKQQRTDEGKLCSETFSSGVNSHVVKEDNVIQAMKEILSQHYHDGHESAPQVHLFRNLWLEAEAELCSLNCKSRFDRLKSKLDASGITESSETVTAVETPSKPAASTNFIARDYFSGTRSLKKNQKLVDSPRSCSNAKAGGGIDVMARFVIPDSHRNDLDLRKDTKQEQKIHVEVPQLQTAKDAEADFLTEKAGLSPPIFFSSVVKGTTCSGENIEDAVMSRFNILLQRDENLSSKQNDLVNTEAIESRFEQNIRHRDFPDQNKAAELESGLSEDMGSPSQRISENFVMSRLNVIKQCDENAGSVEKIAYRETVEVEPGEKPVDGHGAGEIGFSSPNVAHYHDILSSSRSGECMKDSVLNRLKIIKLRHEKQNSAENLVFRESLDLGSTIRGDYLSAFEERSMEGSKAKAEHVLRTETFSRADDAAKMNSAVRFYNLNGSPVNILSGGSFDTASLDWEHVLKEEVAGGTSEQ